jgi:hypothetical protein
VSMCASVSVSMSVHLHGMYLSGVCVCVCVCVRARAHVRVCTRMCTYVTKYTPIQINNEEFITSGMFHLQNY